MRHIAVIISFLIVCLTIPYLEDGIFSTFVFWIIYLIIGNTFIVFNIKGGNQRKALDLYNVTFCVYLIQMVIINIVYVNNPLTDFFVYSDQITFYTISEKLSKSDSIKSIFINANKFYVGILESNKSVGAYSLFGLTGYFSELFDGNNIILQKMNVVFFSSMIPLILYKILIKFFNSSKAFSLSLIYAFLSFNFFYSCLLLRDIHIAFFYIIGIDILLSKYSNKNLIKLIILLFLSYTFRSLSGIFFLSFIVIYIIQNNSITTKHLFSYIFLITLIVSIILYMNIGKIISISMSSIINLMEYSSNRLDNDALRRTLDKLPVGVREISKAALSQLQPFPFWGFLVKNGYPSNERNIFRLSEATAGIFWFYIWIFNLYGIFKQKIRKNIPRIIWYIFILGSVMILSNTVEMNIRRTMSMYAGIYLLSIFVITQISYKTRKQLFILGTIFYAFLTFTYLIIK